MTWAGQRPGDSDFRMTPAVNPMTPPKKKIHLGAWKYDGLPRGDGSKIAYIPKKCVEIKSIAPTTKREDQELFYHRPIQVLAFCIFLLWSSILAPSSQLEIRAFQPRYHPPSARSCAPHRPPPGRPGRPAAPKGPRSIRGRTWAKMMGKHLWMWKKMGNNIYKFVDLMDFWLGSRMKSDEDEERNEELLQVNSKTNDVLIYLLWFN